LQASFFDWLAQNAAITVAIFGIIAVLLFACYVKIYVRIYAPSVEWRHYRLGKLLRSGNGGMVIRVPFIDYVEIDEDTSIGNE
jgi:hypothetical protein